MINRTFDIESKRECNKMIRKMKKLLTICFLLMIAGASMAQTDSIRALKQQFKEKLDAAELIFQMPKGYHLAPVRENKDMHYDYAIYNEDSTMEIRYSIYSLREAIQAYNAKMKKNPKAKLIHPNDMYKATIRASLLKMTGGEKFEISEFPKEAVEAEFLANNGGSCFFIAKNSDFMKGYKYGQFLYLHRDNVSDIIVTFLSNDKEKHTEMMKIPFRSVGYKEILKKIEMK